MDGNTGAAVLEEARAMAAAEELAPPPPQWLLAAGLLLRHRRTLWRALAWGLAASAALALLLPPEYRSTIRLMPPDAQSGAGAMLAAMLARGGPAASALAGALPGARNSGALFVELLRGRSVEQRIAERFALQKVYGKRYQEDAIKKLKARTEIAEERKSGVITVTVTDRERARAQQMAAAYVEELNSLVARVSTSAARRQRLFIAQRLARVEEELHEAEAKLSEFSSSNMTLDVREQTKAMVEAGATLEAQRIAAEAELSGLEQAYGDENVRVRAARAKIAGLRAQMKKFGGTAAGAGVGAGALYPPLKKLPGLAVRWADLYREVKVQEGVYELLTQQYELAKIEEARETPTVQVADAATWPEKKSWPPRTLLVLLGTLAAGCGAAAWVLGREMWAQVDDEDARKAALRELGGALRRRQWREWAG